MAHDCVSFLKHSRTGTSSESYGNGPVITVPSRNTYGGRKEIERWLCDHRIVVGIHVPKVYNFTFCLCFWPRA